MKPPNLNWLRGWMCEAHQIQMQPNGLRGMYCPKCRVEADEERAEEELNAARWRKF